MRAALAVVCFAVAALLASVPRVSGTEKAGAPDSTARDSLSHQDSTRIAPADTIRGGAVAVDVPDTMLAQFDSTRVEEAHPQDSPENKGFLIVTGDRRASLRIRGSIRLSGAYDLGGLQTVYSFDTYLIPTGDAPPDPRFVMSAAQSRVGIEATRETRYGEAFMRIEADFLGDRERANQFLRLRHAYGSIGVRYQLLAGQTWTLLTDAAALPLTVDIDGPNSAVAVRTPQLRATRQGRLGVRYSVSLESPAPDVVLPDSLDPAFQSFPDVGMRAGYFWDRSHLRLAGMLRSITVRDASEGLRYLVGFVGLIGAHRDIGARESVLIQVVAGPSAARFITALEGHGLDALQNPQTGEWELVLSGGAYVSLKHNWTSSTYSYFTVGGVYVENKSFQPPDAFHQSQYISANYFWDTVAGTRVGGELSWGRREDKDAAEGTAARISFITYYDF